MRQVCLGLVCVFCVTVSSFAKDIYVDDDAPGDPGKSDVAISDPAENGSAEHPFDAIKEAISAAVNGDVIILKTGTYSGNGNFDIDPAGLEVTIRSTEPDNPQIVSQTIIDAQENAQIFYIHSKEGANFCISGLTLYRGRATGVYGPYGGGVLCVSSSPKISKCVIKGCQADTAGAGMYISGGAPVIQDCVFENNRSQYRGGGFSCTSSKAQFIRCVIRGNQAINTDGGGVDISGGAVKLTNCLIVGNKSKTGGAGIKCLYNGDTNLQNCTIAGNKVSDAAGFGGGIYCFGEAVITVKNSIIWGNQAKNGSEISVSDYIMPTTMNISYCDVKGGKTAVQLGVTSTLNWDDSSMHDCDPAFVSFAADGDDVNWDFHLKSTVGRWDSNTKTWLADEVDSCALDAGEVSAPWSNEPWPNSKRVNLGCYGNTEQAGKSGNIADFDVDGDVDLRDFAAFASNWMQTEHKMYDFDRNGTVSTEDLARFAQNWLWNKGAE